MVAVCSHRAWSVRDNSHIRIFWENAAKREPSVIAYTELKIGCEYRILHVAYGHLEALKHRCEYLMLGIRKVNVFRLVRLELKEARSWPTRNKRVVIDFARGCIRTEVAVPAKSISLHSDSCSLLL